MAEIWSQYLMLLAQKYDAREGWQIEILLMGEAAIPVKICSNSLTLKSSTLGAHNFCTVVYLIP